MRTGLLAALALGMLMATALPSSGLAATTPQAIVERLARRVEAGDRTLDILVLSAGGQNGAYGAGYLLGWSERSGGLPQFDLVTGVSAGSLMAPFAQDGGPEALATVSDLYLNAVRDITPTPDPLALIRPTGGLTNPKRMRTAVARHVDPARAARIRAAGAEDRQLLVATADLNSGVQVVWNMADELGRPDGLSRSHDILMASSAIPGVIPPVEIDGRTHIDGGVGGVLLLPLSLRDFERLGERLRPRGGSPTTVRLWVIVNMWNDPRTADLRPTARSAIARRSNLLLYVQAQRAALLRLWELGRAVDRGVPGLRMEMRWTAVPGEIAADPAAAKLFDAGFMARLYAAGRDTARGPDPWRTEPPAFLTND
jgi:hypothetical protein